MSAEEPGSRPRDCSVRQRQAAGWLGLGLLLAFAVPAVAYFIFSFRLIAYPYVWENGEGFVLADAQAIHDGQCPYREISDYPFLVVGYPPVYHTLCAAGMWMAGKESFAPGRLITFLAALSVVCAIAKLVYRDTRCLFLAFAGGVSFLSVGCVACMGPVCRVDMLAASLSLWGLCVGHGQLGTKRWVGPVFLFFLAGYVKQSAVSGVAATLVYLWLTDRAKAGKMAGLLLGVGLGALLALALWSGGNFLRHLLTYAWTRFEWHLLWIYARGAVRWGLGLFVLGSVGVVGSTVALARRGRVPKGRWLFIIYLVFNGLSLAQLGLAGVSYLYVTEFTAAACVAFALMCRDLLTLTDGGLRGSWAVASAMVAIAVVHVAWGGKAMRITLKPPLRPGAALAVWILEKTQGPVLAEDAGYLISAGKAVLVNPYFVSQLGAPSRHRWSHEEGDGEWLTVSNETHSDVAAAHDRVLADIRDRRFAAIQTGAILDVRLYGPQPPHAWGSARDTTASRFSPDWQKAIEENYRVDRIVGIGAIYVPR